MNRENKIAETELEIMKVVWGNDMPTPSSDIVKEVKSLKGWEDTTIYTLISRLVKKGFLVQQKQKQVSIYSATITERDYTLEQTQDIIDKLFGGDARQLVSMLYENRRIGASDIEELRQYWEGEKQDE